MNTKYQTIKRFAQKQGFEAINTDKNKLIITTPVFTITVGEKLLGDGIEAIINRKSDGFRALSIQVFSQKSLVEYLSSQKFTDLVAEHTPQEVISEPEEPSEAVESAEVIERITEAKTLAEKVRTELVFTGTLLPKTKEQHHKAVKEFEGLYTVNFTQAEIMTIDSLDHKSAPADFNIMKLNHVESERIFKRNKKYIKQKECYANVYYTINNDEEVFRKISNKEWRIGYGFMQLSVDKTLFVRHAFLINEHDEIIDVTQYVLSKLHLEADYHVVVEIKDLDQYTKLLGKSDFYPAFEKQFMDYFIPYQNKMYNAGLLMLG